MVQGYVSRARRISVAGGVESFFTCHARRQGSNGSGPRWLASDLIHLPRKVAGVLARGRRVVVEGCLSPGGSARGGPLPAAQGGRGPGERMQGCGRLSISWRVRTGRSFTCCARWQGSWREDAGLWWKVVYLLAGPHGAALHLPHKVAGVSGTSVLGGRNGQCHDGGPALRVRPR